MDFQASTASSIMNLFLIFKSLHIFGFVAWFASLFYLFRIFVYHTEAMNRTEPAKSILIKEFNAMEWRVYKIIATPAINITWICGLGMLYIHGWEWFSVNIWMHVKLVLLACLTAYHFYTKKLIRQLEIGENPYTSYQFRLLNELPTIFLLSIALLAVFKNTLNFLYAFLGIIGFGIALVLTARAYRNYREKQGG